MNNCLVASREGSSRCYHVTVLMIRRPPIATRTDTLFPYTTLFRSDRYPREVGNLEPRLKSRLSWGLSVAIEPPDFETRAAIVMAKAQQRGIELPEAVALLMAQRMRSNVRDLEGALNT